MSLGSMGMRDNHKKQRSPDTKQILNAFFAFCFLKSGGASVLDLVF